MIETFSQGSLGQPVSAVDGNLKHAHAHEHRAHNAIDGLTKCDGPRSPSMMLTKETHTHAAHTAVRRHRRR